MQINKNIFHGNNEGSIVEFDRPPVKGGGTCFYLSYWKEEDGSYSPMLFTLSEINKAYNRGAAVDRDDLPAPATLLNRLLAFLRRY